VVEVGKDDQLDKYITDEAEPEKGVAAVGGNRDIPKYISVKGKMIKDPQKATPDTAVETWKCCKILGTGATGSVFSANNETGELCAIKIILIDGTDAKITRALKRELHALAVLTPHANVVQYYGAVKSNLRKCWYVFSELCTGGDLRSVYKRIGPFPTDLLSLVMHSITSGLALLHEMKIVHRDLKGANVFVDDRGRPKIGDFGASAIVHQTRKTSIGTLHWMAPEVLSGNGHKEAADIWSLGCVCLELCTADIPLFKIAPNPKLLCEFVLKRYNPEEIMPKGASPSLKSFLQTCLVTDPDKRPHAKDLLAHEFLKLWRQSDERKLMNLLLENRAPIAAAK
jgi:serine/threonine protein kinase